jgi:hypothetical protein
VLSGRTPGWSSAPGHHPMPGSRRALQQLRRPKLLAPSFGQRRFSFAVARPCGWKLDSLERRRYCGFDMKSCRCEHGDWTVEGPINSSISVHPRMTPSAPASTRRLIVAR